MRQYRINPDALQLRFEMSGKIIDQVAKATGIRPEIIDFMLTGEVETSKE